jgi:hypothetical protein
VRRVAEFLSLGVSRNIMNSPRRFSLLFALVVALTIHATSGSAAETSNVVWACFEKTDDEIGPFG